MDLESRYRGSLLGLACGDAVGTTNEYKAPGSFEPITDMVGGGPFRLNPGEWTDDTSMALCLATSLIESDGFNAKDQMERYCRWVESGYLSSNGRCFDIGGIVNDALMRYRQSGEPYSGSNHPYSSGAGSIMRLAPVVLYYYPNLERLLIYSVESSRTTHASLETLDAIRLLAQMLYRALNGQSKQEILFTSASNLTSPEIMAIAKGEYKNKQEKSIVSTGYVVECLEAALWCFYRTDCFEDAILCAANLGNDADTTAAVCGQLAGAFYGFDGIPKNWSEKVAKRDEILSLADSLLAAAS